MLSYCSIEYLLVFLPVVFLIYQILPREPRRYWLLAASYGFFWYLSGPLLLWHVAVCAAVWLIVGWFRERKGCAGCRHCGGGLKAVPSFAVGMAYGLSPCAPLLMVLGYAAALTVPAALMLGTVFALASSLIPALLILVLAGALSTKITAQLGRALPRFQLAVYGFYLISAVWGLMR